MREKTNGRRTNTQAEQRVKIKLVAFLVAEDSEQNEASWTWRPQKQHQVTGT